ncbi:MAG: hypothetical protein AAGC46_00725 [Solirubrobacteraceae bacterium]|nr:hypothetical protein [Patulibacter sp.]
MSSGPSTGPAIDASVERRRRRLVAALGAVLAVAVIVAAIFAPGGSDTGKTKVSAATKATVAAIEAGLPRDGILHWTATQDQPHVPGATGDGPSHTTIDQWTDLRTHASHVALVATSRNGSGSHLEAWFDGSRTAWTSSGTGAPKGLHKTVVYKVVYPKPMPSSLPSPVAQLRTVLDAVSTGRASVADGTPSNGIPTSVVHQRTADTDGTFTILRSTPPQVIEQVGDVLRPAAARTHVTTKTTGWRLFPRDDATARSHVDARFDPARYDVQPQLGTATTP